MATMNNDAKAEGEADVKNASPTPAPTPAPTPSTAVGAPSPIMGAGEAAELERLRRENAELRARMQQDRMMKVNNGTSGTGNGLQLHPLVVLITLCIGILSFALSAAIVYYFIFSGPTRNEDHAQDQIDSASACLEAVIALNSLGALAGVAVKYKIESDARSKRLSLSDNDIQHQRMLTAQQRAAVVAEEKAAQQRIENNFLFYEVSIGVVTCVIFVFIVFLRLFGFRMLKDYSPEATSTSTTSTGTTTTTAGPGSERL